MKIGFVGLGKMGNPMVSRILAAGHEVVVRDVSEEAMQALVDDGAESSSSYTDLVSKLPEKKIIWLMIPSKFVEQSIAEVIEALPEGSILIDGGNTNFLETVEHAKKAEEQGVSLLDVGVSGGLAGLEHGFSVMAGGDAQSYQEIEPIVASLAQEGGHGHFGPSGAGHFVKMVHNAIEYGAVEAFAEGFNLIKSSPYGDTDLAKLTDVWQNGSIIRSYLNELSNDVFSERPGLDGIDGKIGEMGEGRWAAEYAEGLGVEVGTVTHALDARAASRDGGVNFGTKYISAMRNKWGGHPVNDEIQVEGHDSK